MGSEMVENKSNTGKIILWIILGLGVFSCICVLLVAIFAGGIAGVITGAVRSSEVYQYAMDSALNDPEVIEVLGEPIEAGLFVQGSINVDGPTGEASLAIPLKGAERNGTLHVVADRIAGEWRYTVLEVAFDDLPRRIDLLEP
jgi:hypothetical protein